MKTCSVQGCGKPAASRGKWCSMHKGRWQRHGDPLKRVTVNHLEVAATGAKDCTVCADTKPLSEFYLTHGRPDGRCKECARAAVREYRSANREIVLERQRAYSKEYRTSHPDRVRARQERYLATNPERVRGLRRAISRRYYTRHRDERIALAAVRTARIRNAVVRERVKVKALAARDRDICGLCGKRVAWRDRSIDHIIPVSLGGDHSYANTHLAHKRCNFSRGNRGPAQLLLIGDVA